MFFPASGHGEQSKYYDDDLLMDGTYSIISVTIDSISRDTGNSVDQTILRKGLLLAKTVGLDGLYTPLSTVDGYLNGTPTQYMEDVVVLAREEHMIYTYIRGGKYRRTIAASDRIVPVYLACNIKQEKILHNNKATLEVTDAQWDNCQRIRIVPTFVKKFDRTEGVRSLLWYRKETKVTKQDFS